MSVVNDEYYGDVKLLNEYLAMDTMLKEVNYDELINRGNSNLVFLYILIPLLVMVLAIVVTLLILKTKKRD